MDKFLEFFNKATNIQPILDQLKSGKVIRKTLSLLYRAVAVLMGLGLLGSWFYAWQGLKHISFFGGLALLVWQIVFLYGAFLALKTLYIRAREIQDYPDSDYVVAPVMAMLTKTSGEMVFIFLGVMSVPAMLLAWFGVNELPIELGSGFLVGIATFIACWIIGFFTLIITQFLAEWVLALFSIASDLNILRRNAVPADKETVAETPVAAEPTEAS